MVSNTKSCTPQPNSGRMGRSPGAVMRMISIAWSTSVSPEASAMPPRRSTVRGNESPEPRSSVIDFRTYPMLMSAPEMFTIACLSRPDVDRWLPLTRPSEACASTVIDGALIVTDCFDSTVIA